jgi:NAD(P)-dependent dehydrogenase (short-subunit alcohol dehydrogenase family)
VNRLHGKVAIVTGSAQGIGRATALAIAAEGGRVVVADINVQGAEAVAGEIAAAGGAAVALALDVTEESSVAALMADATSHFGGLDVLHNNAALQDPAFMSQDRAITELDLATWHRAIAVNLTGPFLCCKHAIPHMLDRGGGAIVNMASAAAFRGLPRLPAYSMTKAGVVSLTMSVAAQFGDRGIRCNAVAPGTTLTPANLANSTAEAREVLRSETLVRRLAEPEDIAAAVVFLASDEARYITAQTLRVDGGRLARW